MRSTQRGRIQSSFQNTWKWGYNCWTWGLKHIDIGIIYPRIIFLIIIFWVYYDLLTYIHINRQSTMFGIRESNTQTSCCQGWGFQNLSCKIEDMSQKWCSDPRDMVILRIWFLTSKFKRYPVFAPFVFWFALCISALENRTTSQWNRSTWRSVPKVKTNVRDRNGKWKGPGISPYMRTYTWRVMTVKSHESVKP